MAGMKTELAAALRKPKRRGFDGKKFGEEIVELVTAYVARETSELRSKIADLETRLRELERR